MRNRRLRVLAGLCLLLLAALPALGATGAPTPGTPGVDRLTHLAKLWGTVRYLHPYLAYKEIDWDAALVKAVPAVRSAKTSQEYAKAVQGMLDVLGDPLTRVKEKEKPAEKEKAAAPSPLLRWQDEKTLVVDLRSRVGYSGYVALIPELPELFKAVARAETLVLDLRQGALGGDVEGGYEFTLGPIQPLLTRRALRAPTLRYRLYSGYPPQDGSTSGGYWSGFANLAAQTFSPSASGGPSHVAFLVTSHTPLPPVALALQAGGDGVLVSEGELGEETVVSTQQIDLGEGLEARVRVSELLPMAGWSGIHSDARIAPGTVDEEAVKTALAAIATQGRSQAAPATALTLPDAVARPDDAYPKMLDPSPEYRILAVARAWNVIHYFYPYKHLIGDWDAVLPEFVGRMEEVHDAHGYALAVAEMMARVADGHTGVFGHPELLKIYGEVGAPVLPRWIEGKWVVATLRDHPAVPASGLQVGDVITAVDGEPVEARVERLRKVLAASTEGGFREKVRRYLLAGPEGSTLTLAVTGRDGAAREVKLPRERRRYAPETPTGETVRILPGNLGYMDLTRLTVPEVDGMLEKLKDTRGIVFDMRGYPKGVFLALGSRLNSRGARFAAQFRRSEVSAFSAEEEDAGYYFSQAIPKTDKWIYKGKTVMLIDAQAVSQSEHTGLFLEAASGVKFVGSPTAGANGDVTTFTLPGNITVAFTGHDVRHADGRQLQRVGLVPDVPAEPTIQGLREGKDEVLDRAVRYLEEELKASSPSSSPPPVGAGSPAGPVAAPGTGGAGSAR